MCDIFLETKARSILWVACLTVFLGCARSPKNGDPAPAAVETAAQEARALPAGGAAPAEPHITKLSDKDVEARVRPHLRAGETLAYDVFAGPLGPSPDTALALIDRAGGLAGFAVVERSPGSPERIPLPVLSEGMLDKVLGVAFVDAGKRPGLEVVIMSAQMTGIGPEGAIPQQVNAVVTWDGSAFARLAEVEEAIYDKKTEAEIRAALQARP